MPARFNRSKYASIPESIWQHYERIQAEQLSHRLLEAIETQGADKTWKGFDEIFRLASQATGLTPDDLLKRLGFNVNDLDEANFQATIGILRTINLLKKIGFGEFQPLPPVKSRREVDLFAKFGNKRCAIEVFRSSEKAYRWQGHKKPSSNAATYIAGRYQEKRSQIESSVKQHQSDVAILVIIMDSAPFKQLNGAEEAREALQEAYGAIANPPNLHLLIFTGMDNPPGTPEFAIYPALSGEIN